MTLLVVFCVVFGVFPLCAVSSRWLDVRSWMQSALCPKNPVLDFGFGSGSMPFELTIKAG